MFQTGVNVSGRYRKWPVFSRPLMAGFGRPPRVNGERRRFDLLRDAGDDGQDISIAVDRIRRALLDAWARCTAAGKPPEKERPEANEDSTKGALLLALQEIAHLLPDGRSVRIRKHGELNEVEVAILPPAAGDND